MLKYIDKGQLGLCFGRKQQRTRALSDLPYFPPIDTLSIILSYPLLKEFHTISLPNKGIPGTILIAESDISMPMDTLFIGGNFYSPIGYYILNFDIHFVPRLPQASPPANVVFLRVGNKLI